VDGGVDEVDGEGVDAGLGVWVGDVGEGFGEGDGDELGGGGEKVGKGAELGRIEELGKSCDHGAGKAGTASETLGCFINGWLSMLTLSIT
jgi:hypothetical protein